MLDYIKRLITPDMVSFWLPSGQSRAMDIIRGNHGQCHGTHPNVPVLPSLINPSVGWHFDGVDDYVGLESNVVASAAASSISSWFNLTAFGGILMGYSENNSQYIHFPDSTTIRIQGDVAAQVKAFTIPAMSLNTWYYLVITRDSGTVRVYLDAVESSSGGQAIAADLTINQIGKYFSGATNWYDGYVALPFVANTGWSLQQVENFYNATKGMFAPRG